MSIDYLKVFDSASTANVLGRIGTQATCFTFPDILLTMLSLISSF